MSSVRVMNAECYDDDDVCITAVSTRHGDGDWIDPHWSRNGNDLVPSLGDDGREPVVQREGLQQSSELARYVDATRGNQNQPNDAGRL